MGYPAVPSAAGAFVRAFQAAWSAISHTMPGPHHYRDGVTRTVSIGNDTDTDTVAAIAGTMLCAASGVPTIPDEWLGVLQGCPDIDQVTSLHSHAGTQAL